MFSEIQRDYIKQLVLTNNKEYPYYLAFTHTDISGGYVTNADTIEFYVVLSRGKITANTKYSYSCADTNFIVFAVRSRSANNSYHAERVTNVTHTQNFLIDNYEFVYTNAEFESASLQPNLIETNTITNNTFNGFGIALLIVLIGVITFKLVGGR